MGTGMVVSNFSRFGDGGFKFLEVRVQFISKKRESLLQPLVLMRRGREERQTRRAAYG